MMDFSLGETQQTVVSLAAEVLGGADPWKELARAGLLDASELGLLEVAVLLTEIGRHATHDSLKALATLMTGALPVLRWGSADLQQALLPGVTSGELTLTAALREPSDPAPAIPATTVTNRKITGTKVGVPFAEQSFRLLVPSSMIMNSLSQITAKTVHDHEVARTGVVLVARGAPGVRLTRTPSSSGQPDCGATSEDFGRVTVADRRHAAANPQAWFYQRPVTLAEHQASRWIAEPLRLLDCCQESDGAVAVVVTSLDRARDLPHRPAVIRAAAQGAGPDQFTMTSYYRDDLTGLPEMGLVAGQLWRQARIGPADVPTAVLYDHFTPYVLIQLEELGFCGRGEARDYIAGCAIELGGRLPVNPHGGQLGEAYIDGMNGIAEAVRQVRGTSVNQVPGDGPVLVTAGTGVPTSGLILS